MRLFWLILIFLTACLALPPEPHGLAGLLIPTSQLPKWAATPKYLELSANEIPLNAQLTVTLGPADFAWGIAYVYTDHKIWEKVIINPLLNKDAIVQQWVKGTAIFTLSITSVKFTPGKTYYVLGYSCNKGKTWDCNGNKWMLTSFKVKQLTVSVDKELDDLMQDIDDTDKILNTSYEPEETGIEELNIS